MLTTALEPILSVTPALQEHLCKVGKEKSNFPGMNKPGPFTHPNTVFRRGDGGRVAVGPLQEGLFVEQSLGNARE